MSETAAMESLAACKTCGQLQRIEALQADTVAECSRCGSRLGKHAADSLGRTTAFSLAALMFFVPANIYPILHMDFYGAYSESTVWDGCVKLFQDGEWPVAAIVFVASILVPILKLLGLFFLVMVTKFKHTSWRHERKWIYKFIDVVGPWAMLDVFLLSVLVALVKLGQLATVYPGRGLFAFTAMVVFTLLASASFDPTLIWDKTEKKR